MKKLIKLLTLVSLFSIVLVGCDSGGGTNVGEIRNEIFTKVGELDDSYHVLRDIKTGCTYIESRSDWSIMPLYDKQGKVAGCGDTDFYKLEVKE